MTHRFMGTSRIKKRCMMKGRKDVQPPTNMLVTTDFLAGRRQMKVQTKKVVIAFPIPMCGTKIRPTQKEERLASRDRLPVPPPLSWS
mmetsp:Transcript_24376/g.48535  ORF Transcript_24376/g.48535 Transcript_24376/m.48535 type:complete len:87 (+) Transcript_24376:190-450(+)